MQLLDTQTHVAYERIKPGKTKRLRRFNMGFMTNQVAATACRIVDAVIEG